jgi:MOSC domain-containing protein YiiM
MFDGLEDDVRAAPTRVGTVRLIVRRPAVDEREVVTEAHLDVAEGVVGDTWRVRGSSSTADGSPNPEAQITVMNARAAAAFAGDLERWPLAGDQLYVDFDVSETNLPAGTRVRVGEAEIEVSAKPHTGCAKFSARFGADALRMVSTPTGRSLRLRGMNARVTKSGVIRVGDSIERATSL